MSDLDGATTQIIHRNTYIYGVRFTEAFITLGFITPKCYYVLYRIVYNGSHYNKGSISRSVVMLN